MSWINHDIKLNFKLTKVLENTIKEAEYFDKIQSVEYFAVAEGIEILGKQYVASGYITEKDWYDLMNKYPSVE